MYKDKKVLWGSICEARGRWAPGWTARVCILWTDTPRQRGGSKPCLDKRPRISYSWGQREFSDYTCWERLNGSKGSEVNLP